MSRSLLQVSHCVAGVHRKHLAHEYQNLRPTPGTARCGSVLSLVSRTEYLAANKDVLGKEPIGIKDTGATDGRFFADYGIPVIIQHPTGVNLHGKEEYTLIDTLEPIYEIFKRFIERVG